MQHSKTKQPVELKEFQEASAQRIVTSLTDEHGPRRFLLADEVGLGKTIVACRVIELLKQRTRGRQFNVVYVCSNSEIAHQNQKRLNPSSNGQTTSVDRLTLWPLSMKQSRNHEVNIFSFTPGTSFNFDRATGIKRERRFLLYLLHRVWGKPIGGIRWREFFKCTAGESWYGDTSFRRMKHDFDRKLDEAFVGKVKDHFEKIPGGVHETKKKLRKSLDAAVTEYYRTGDTKDRNEIIGRLRKAVAFAALEYLDARLVILDEFQRFKSLLRVSPDSVEGKLFAKNTPILILSATPYKMYTREFEAENHYEDFRETLEFLFEKSKHRESASTIVANLEKFRRSLTATERVDHRDLVRLKQEIEFGLKQVMLRNERNYYLEARDKGIEEVIHGEIDPTEETLADYLYLQHLGHELTDSSSLTEYWKSGDSLLSVMDDNYELIRKLKGQKVRRTSKDSRLYMDHKALDAFEEVAPRNCRLRSVCDAVLPRSGMRFLWVEPCLKYYEDTFFQKDSPSKFLLFSNWKFVPKLISILLSYEAERSLYTGRGIRYTQKKRSIPPFLFKPDGGGFSVLNVFYPSLWLAKHLSFFEILRKATPDIEAKTLSREKLEETAKSLLTEKLLSMGFQLVPKPSRKIWEILLALDQKELGDDLVEQIDSSKVEGLRDSKDGTESYKEYRIRMLNVLGNPSERMPVTVQQIHTLSRIALYSPACTILRSCLSLQLGDSENETFGKVLNMCLNELRNYFNRPLVHEVIQSTIRKGRAWERVLSYCADAHFQSVIDEHLYQLRESGMHSAKDIVTQLKVVFGLVTGSPQITVKGNGTLTSKKMPIRTHYALSFNESSNEEGQGNAQRRTGARVAFNSPFWPFVLATTSVGQEGLDFHLYCHNIIHWNLPSNPVDLEQREGRINRYNSFALRKSIAHNYSIEQLLKLATDKCQNPWAIIFDHLTRNPSSKGKFKKGLYPNWIYEDNPAHEVKTRRHLLFYRMSRDIERYEELKKALTLYRIAFGQPRQDDLLNHVQHLVEKGKMSANEITAYMINLSPFGIKESRQRAERKADSLLREHGALLKLVNDVKELLRTSSAELKDMEPQVRSMIANVDDCLNGRSSISEDYLRKNIAALYYLVDPYDAIFDGIPTLGFEDDKEWIAQILEGAN